MASSKKLGLSIGGVIILAIGVISFVVAPMLTDRGGNTSATVVGKWNNIKIDAKPNSTFVERYRFLRQYVDSQNMVPKNPQQREFFENQLLRLSFEMAVFDTAMQDQLNISGYTAPQFMINKELVNYYLDENGFYSQAKYEQTPDSRKLELQNAMIKFLTTSRYIEDLFGNGNSYGLKTSSKETEMIVNMAKKEKSFKFVNFKPSFYPVAKVIKYGKDHKDLFTNYDLSLLTYHTEEEAKKILASIKAGEITFEDAIILNTNKIITNDSGKLLSNYRKDINKYFPDNENLKLILELKTEEMSPVVKLYNQMFAIVRCDSEPTDPNFESEETIEKIRDYINKNERGTVEDYLLKEAKEFAKIAKKDGLETAANSFKENELKVETTNSFTVNYGNTSFLQPVPTQGVLYAVVGNENFFKTAFKLAKDEISEPLLVGSEVLVLSLNEEKEVDQYTIDSTKTGYKNQAGSWLAYYYAAKLMRFQGLNYPLPVAQKTFMEFVLKNPKFEDNFSSILK